MIDDLGTPVDAQDDEGTSRNDDQRWVDDGEQTGRFAGDVGTWEPSLRDAVVHLYKRRFISRTQHPQHWEPLLRNLAAVRADLHNHNLDLVIDTTREVMFKRQAPIEDGAPTLLRDVSYTLEETALLVSLRALALETTESVARIDHAELLSLLSEFRPAQVADERAKAEREERAVKRMVEVGILRRDDTDEGYTIDRVIEVAMPYATLVALHDTLLNAPDLDPKSDNDGPVS